MNKARRAKIAAIRQQLDDMVLKIEELSNEEREAFDAMPEGLQDSDRGHKSEEAASELENAACNLQDVINSLEAAEE